MPARARHRCEAAAFFILLPWATRIEMLDDDLRARLGGPVFTKILEDVPDAWLLPEPGASTPAEKRAAYVHYLGVRLNAASSFIEEAVGARAALL